MHPPKPGYQGIKITYSKRLSAYEIKTTIKILSLLVLRFYRAFIKSALICKDSRDIPSLKIGILCSLRPHISVSAPCLNKLNPLLLLYLKRTVEAV